MQEYFAFHKNSSSLSGGSLLFFFFLVHKWVFMTKDFYDKEQIQFSDNSQRGMHKWEIKTQGASKPGLEKFSVICDML